MPIPNLTPSEEPVKPARVNKPCPDFPLTAYPAGYWCKKIRGRLHYFGPRFKPGDSAGATAAADAALTEYLEQADALLAGRKPREETDGLTVKESDCPKRDRPRRRWRGKRGSCICPRRGREWCRSWRSWPRSSWQQAPVG